MKLRDIFSFPKLSLCKNKTRRKLLIGYRRVMYRVKRLIDRRRSVRFLTAVDGDTTTIRPATYLKDFFFFCENFHSIFMFYTFSISLNVIRNAFLTTRSVGVRSMRVFIQLSRPRTRPNAPFSFSFRYNLRNLLHLPLGFRCFYTRGFSIVLKTMVISFARQYIHVPFAVTTTRPKRLAVVVGQQLRPEFELIRAKPLVPLPTHRPPPKEYCFFTRSAT